MRLNPGHAIRGQGASIVASADMTIRNAAPRDAKVIAQIEIDAWRDAYPTLLPSAYLVDRLDLTRRTAFWRRRLGHPKHRVLLAVTDGPEPRALGYAAWGRYRAKGAADAGELYELYVAPEEQDRGVGRSLCAAIAEEAISLGWRSVYAEVLDGNPSRFFYETMGAQIAGYAEVTFSGDSLPSVIYVWNDLVSLLADQVRRS